MYEDLADIIIKHTLEADACLDMLEKLVPFGTFGVNDVVIHCCQNNASLAVLERGLRLTCRGVYFQLSGVTVCMLARLDRKDIAVFLKKRGLQLDSLDYYKDYYFHDSYSQDLKWDTFSAFYASVNNVP